MQRGKAAAVTILLWGGLLTSPFLWLQPRALTMKVYWWCKAPGSCLLPHRP